MEIKETMFGDPKKTQDNDSLCIPEGMMKSMKNIFSGIRHEIGNPINSIKMTVGVLKENIDRYPREKIIEYIDRVLTETDRLDYLLRCLKNFSMYENLELKNVYLPGFMEKYLAKITPGLKQKGISLTYHIPPELGNIHTDVKALTQVLQNIMNNAVDALEGIKDPAISINVAKVPGKRRFIITDNGHGIAPAHQKEIFKPFFSTRARRTGLGLCMVQIILTQMNGTILIQSKVNSGTSVMFHIPEDNHDVT